MVLTDGIDRWYWQMVLTNGIDRWHWQMEVGSRGGWPYIYIYYKYYYIYIIYIYIINSQYLCLCWFKFTHLRFEMGTTTPVTRKTNQFSILSQLWNSISQFLGVHKLSFELTIKTPSEIAVDFSCKFRTRFEVPPCFQIKDIWLKQTDSLTWKYLENQKPMKNRGFEKKPTEK